MPPLLKPAAEKLKGKLPAAKASIDNVIKLANTPLKPNMPPGVEAQAEALAQELKAGAQGIMQAFKAYEASLQKVLAKA